MDHSVSDINSEREKTMKIQCSIEQQ